MKTPPVGKVLSAAIQELAAVLHLAGPDEIEPVTGERDGRAHGADAVLQTAVPRVVQRAGRDREDRGARADQSDRPVEVQLLPFLELGAVFRVLQLVVQVEVELGPQLVERRLGSLPLEREARREECAFLRLLRARASLGG